MVALPFEYKETLLKIEGVSKMLGDTQVLKNVNAEIRNLTRPGMTQGQVVALLGPSGVGKTTLFRMLAGLEAPDEGRITMADGHTVRRGEVGVVAQNYPLFNHRTVLSNLVIAAKLAGQSGGEATDRAKALLHRFNLGDQMNKYPVQLSGGQRQRVAIAQQIMCGETLLLMDEPFSGLDLVALQSVVDLILEIAASDELQTFVIVTHDINAAMAVADTIWLLGRDRDARGEPIPGARIQRTISLAELGIAWRKGISETPECVGLRREIRELFPRL